MSGISKAFYLVLFCLYLVFTGAASAHADDQDLLANDGSLDTELNQPAIPENDAFEEVALPSPAEGPQPELAAKPKTKIKKANLIAQVAKVKTQKHTNIIPMPSPAVLELPNKVLGRDNYEWLLGGLVCTSAFFFGFAFLLWRLLPKKRVAKQKTQTRAKIEYWNLGHTSQG